MGNSRVGLIATQFIVGKDHVGNGGCITIRQDRLHLGSQSLRHVDATGHRLSNFSNNPIVGRVRFEGCVQVLHSGPQVGGAFERHIFRQESV